MVFDAAPPKAPPKGLPAPLPFEGVVFWLEPNKPGAPDPVDPKPDPVPPKSWPPWPDVAPPPPNSGLFCPNPAAFGAVDDGPLFAAPCPPPLKLNPDMVSLEMGRLLGASAWSASCAGLLQSQKSPRGVRSQTAGPDGWTRSTERMLQVLLRSKRNGYLFRALFLLERGVKLGGRGE